MIKIPKRIDFKEPVRLHAPSKWYNDHDKKTIYEVAEELEKRYSVVQKFIAIYKVELEKILKQEILFAIKYRKEQIEFDTVIIDKVRVRWRSFIMNEEHGIKTKASRDREDPSFIDTSDYYLNMEPELIYD